jgi:chromosome segregation ATPase
MKNFHQNLLIILALALCALCAFQWYGQTRQRLQMNQQGQLISQQLAAIQNFTNTIATLQNQLAQSDIHITALRDTIKTNNEFILTQKRELNRLAAENESLTNQITQYQTATAALEGKLKEAYDGIKKQNDAIKELAAQRDDFVQKLNDSVKDRNTIVAKYNDLAAKVEKFSVAKP